MRKLRFWEEQIVGILREYAAWAKFSELCRKNGMSDAPLYKLKARYGSMSVSELCCELGVKPSLCTDTSFTKATCVTMGNACSALRVSF